jgi:predicted nucleic acid-binding protein
MRFFDASALVKRYVRERGSASIRRLLDEGDVAVSRLSEVEVTSALVRVSREGGISTQQRDRAINTLVSDLAAWTIVEVSSDVAVRARNLLLRHVLRAGDAVQLASALLIAEHLGGLAAFVAHDARLAAAAVVEGVPVHTPG